MDKDKSPAIGGGGGLPPHSSRYSGFGMKCESSEPGQFSHDISQMPDCPPRSTGHRRAQSEILGLPDDISFDSDLGVVGSGEGPSLSDETDEYLQFMYLDMDKFMSASVTPGLDLSGAEASEMGGAPAQLVSLAEGSGSGSSERPRIRHQHSQSMDGSSSIKPEMLGAGGEGASLVDAKKAMSAAKLADLALIDPKRAKRIWANRQSAARSKERKMRYIAELERKMQTMQTEATTLSAQLGLLQRDTTGLTAENSELKLRVQGMEQQVHLQDALNDALREEVQRLKVATGQTNFPNGAPMMNYGASSFGGNQNLYHHNHAMQSLLAAQPLQQLQLHSQHQQQLHQHQHQYQQHSPSDRKLRNAMTSQTQRESTSDNINTPKE